MDGFTFRVKQYAYDADGSTIDAEREWVVHFAGLNLVRAEVLSASQSKKDHFRYLIIINGDAFRFKRFQHPLAPQWVYYNRVSRYMPYTDFYFTVNSSDLFYRYFCSTILMARDLVSASRYRSDAFNILLAHPVLCPYPHVTHRIRGRWSGQKYIPTVVKGFDFNNREVWRAETEASSVKHSNALPKRVVTTVRAGLLYQRVMQGDPTDKPGVYRYYITRTAQRLPERRVVKDYAVWRSQPVLDKVEASERTRFTRLEFSNYAVTTLSEAVFELSDRPNFDAARTASRPSSFGKVRPPYVEPPPEGFLKDEEHRQGLKRVRNAPTPMLYRGAFESFQFEQTLVLSIMENIMLLHAGRCLLP